MLAQCVRMLRAPGLAFQSLQRVLVVMHRAFWWCPGPPSQSQRALGRIALDAPADFSDSDVSSMAVSLTGAPTPGATTAGFEPRLRFDVRFDLRQGCRAALRTCERISRETDRFSALRTAPATCLQDMRAVYKWNRHTGL